MEKYLHGRIVKGVGGNYDILLDEPLVKENGELTDKLVCRARGVFRHEGETPLVGDFAEIRLDNDDNVMISKINERKNSLIRPPMANLDILFVMFAAKKPEPVKGALELFAEPLYISSTAEKKSAVITGTYYLWDSEVVRGRVKITNMPENIGKAGQVTGWISAAAVKLSSTIHPVLWGDTLGEIAKKYGTTVESIVDANKAKYPNITADYIVAGWTLVIPK